MSETSRPDHLRVEHLATAFGIDTTRPRLSWWLPDGAGRQSGYRIRTDNGWDSGHVTSDESVLVGYGGPPLGPGERVSWQVKVWTEHGESEWSQPHAFELGLLEPGRLVGAVDHAGRAGGRARRATAGDVRARRV